MEAAGFSKARQDFQKPAKKDQVYQLTLILGVN
jgi:hypothetical protein